MKCKLIPLMIFALVITNGYANQNFKYDRELFPPVKVITRGGKIILGQLQHVSDSSIYVLPGTSRELRKGRSYELVEIPYSDIISIRYKELNWIALILGLAGMAIIYLMITGVIPIFNNGLGEANIWIWLSPVVFAYGLFHVFKRKRYVINGRKERFHKFKQWFEKKPR